MTLDGKSPEDFKVIGASGAVIPTPIYPVSVTTNLGIVPVASMTINLLAADAVRGRSATQENATTTATFVNSLFLLFIVRTSVFWENPVFVFRPTHRTVNGVISIVILPRPTVNAPDRTLLP